MTRLVIDASVAVKWVVTEDGTDEAVSLLSRHGLSAPDLLVAECANILWKKVRRSELTAQEAMVAAKIIQRADVELHPMRALMEPAAKLAIDLDHPAYDCIYLALAMAHGWQFVTADLRFLNKVRQSLPAVAQSVLSLEEAAGGSGGTALAVSQEYRHGDVSKDKDEAEAAGSADHAEGGDLRARVVTRAGTRGIFHPRPA